MRVKEAAYSVINRVDITGCSESPLWICLLNLWTKFLLQLYVQYGFHCILGVFVVFKFVLLLYMLFYCSLGWLLVKVIRILSLDYYLIFLTILQITIDTNFWSKFKEQTNIIYLNCLIEQWMNGLNIRRLFHEYYSKLLKFRKTDRSIATITFRMKVLLLS